MNLKTNIDNNVFIFENLIDDSSIIDLYLTEIDKKILDEDFYARIKLVNKETHDFAGLSGMYSDFTKFEKFIFNNSNKLSTSTFLVDRKDIDINSSSDTLKFIENKILDAVKIIYKDILDKIYIDYSSTIGYSDGYKMNKHTDGGSINNRICTAVFYLNSKNNNIGGNVIFYDKETGKNKILNYSPTKNDLIIFDSYYNNDTLEHEVTEIKKWNRYVHRIYFKINKL